jgi:hypothetical protein
MSEPHEQVIEHLIRMLRADKGYRVKQKQGKRMAIVLRFAMGDSVVVIAQDFGMTESAVRAQIHEWRDGKRDARRYWNHGVPHPGPYRPRVRRGIAE